jgi:hypothetical protein
MINYPVTIHIITTVAALLQIYRNNLPKPCCCCCSIAAAALDMMLCPWCLHVVLLAPNIHSPF